MKIKNFTPATGWFFVHKDVNGIDIEHDVAGFATIEGENGASDRVVGMVSVTGGGPDDKVMPGTCHLVTVPPLPGTYTRNNMA